MIRNLLFTLLCGVSSINVSAYWCDFEVDGILYKLYPKSVNEEIVYTASVCCLLNNEYDDYMSQKQQPTAESTSQSISPKDLPDYSHGCTGWKSFYNGDIVIPKSVTYNGVTYAVDDIDIAAFANCMGLKSVTMPNTIEHINICGFCQAPISSIVLSENLYSLGRWSFYGCTNLKSIEIPASLRVLGRGCFAGSGITEITLPNAISSIDRGAFSDLEKVSFDGKAEANPYGYPILRAGAFQGALIEQFTFPKANFTLQSKVAEQNDVLKRLIIPEVENVSIPSDAAFVGCDNLTEVVCCGTIPPANDSDDGMLFDDYSGRVLVVPAGSEDYYRVAPVWREFPIIKGVADIEHYVTSGITGIESDTDMTAPIEYYNLQGIRVSTEKLAPGIYIRRQGSKASKIFVTE